MWTSQPGHEIRRRPWGQRTRRKGQDRRSRPPEILRSKYKTGLPNVKTNGPVLNPRLNVLAVDTYGRGLWEIALSDRPDLSAGWSAAEVGSPGQPGDAYFDGSTWTVSGGGADIAGTSDQFDPEGDACL